MANFVTTLPLGQNAIHHIAQTMLREHAARLPDLNGIVVLLPGYAPATALRHELLRIANSQGIDALLLPAIYSLRDFLNHTVPPTDRIIPEEQRFLLLVDALRKHRRLYGTSNPWLLAADLLKLFDELTLHRVSLPQTAAAFADLLSRCYTLTAQHPALLREAQIVHTLWQAWHQQLQAEDWIDTSRYYLQQLGQSLQQLPPHSHFYIGGFNRFTAAEQEWLHKLAQQHPVSLTISGSVDNSELQPQPGFIQVHNTNNSFSAFLQAALSPADTPLSQRARAFANSCKQSPAADRIHIQPAHSFEQEVQQVALHVQRGLQQGVRQIGIVTEDRKLARRLRAYLERSGIELNDTVGWALSTTRAAALLENWLQCIENDFPYHAFLDLLKSAAPPGDKDYLKLIYRFEMDIVLHENIGSGIERYRRALQYRAARLPWWNNTVRSRLHELLDQYESAAMLLRKFLEKPAPAQTLSDGLLRSLQQLHLHRLFANDEAGCKVLTLLDRIQRSATTVVTEIDWVDFRTWIGYTLETHYFSPVTSSPQVQLLNLQQSALQHFDLLIIAAADECKFPGTAGGLPFFNDAVRSALNLPDWNDRLRERQYQFRCLLENNPVIFISWQQESNGEPIALSPWIEIINYFHAIAYGRTLITSTALSTQDNAPIHTTALPPIPECPQPAVTAETMPADITVSAHQRLLNCPYQFYAFDILKLKATDEIREALQKSDYGDRVHQCLQAFHCGISGLPEPFKQKLSAQNRTQAITRLEQIAHAVFTHDIEDNFQHRGWLHRWLARIPDYIDWQIEHDLKWTVENAEQQYQVALDGVFTLRGRIDRIERQGADIALIDYKTGKVPTLDEVLTGEDVQLPSYSLLMPAVTRVQYLGLDEKRINDRTVIADDVLAELKPKIQARLLNTLSRIRDGAALPASGKPPVCDYCDASGLCRRKIWQRQQQKQPAS